MDKCECTKSRNELSNYEVGGAFVGTKWKTNKNRELKVTRLKQTITIRDKEKTGIPEVVIEKQINDEGETNEYMLSVDMFLDKVNDLSMDNERAREVANRYL